MVLLILENFIRGSRRFNSVIGVTPCGAVYWVLYGVFVLICMAFGVFGIMYARYTLLAKERCGYPFMNGDI